MSVLPSQANQSQIQMLTLSMKFSKNSQTEPERPTGTSTSTVTETETSSSSSYSQLSNRASRGAPSKISPVDISSNSNDANCGWVEGVGVVFDVDPEPKSYLSSLQQRTQVPETAQSECSHQTPRKDQINKSSRPNRLRPRRAVQPIKNVSGSQVEGPNGKFLKVSPEIEVKSAKSKRTNESPDIEFRNSKTIRLAASPEDTVQIIDPSRSKRIRPKKAVQSNTKTLNIGHESDPSIVLQKVLKISGERDNDGKDSSHSKARLKPLAISYNHTRPVSKSPDKSCKPKKTSDKGIAEVFKSCPIQSSECQASSGQSPANLSASNRPRKSNLVAEMQSTLSKLDLPERPETRTCQILTAESQLELFPAAQTPVKITQADPNLLCPFCDEPLPKNPSKKLSELLLYFKEYPGVQKREDSVNSLALYLPFSTTASFCQQHQDEKIVIPNGIKKGWPTKIDFRNLPKRIKKHFSRLTDICEGTIASNFLTIATLEWKKQGSKLRNITNELSTFEIEQPGYYGVKGFEIIFDTLHRHFLSPHLLNSTTEYAKPLPIEYYVRRVLLPETALCLIAEDLKLSPNDVQVRKTLDESRKYGVALFPDEEACLNESSDEEDERLNRSNERKRQIAKKSLLLRDGKEEHYDETISTEKNIDTRLIKSGVKSKMHQKSVEISEPMPIVPIKSGDRKIIKQTGEQESCSSEEEDMVEKKKFGYKTLSDKQERQSSIIKDLTEEDELEEKSYISDSEEPEEQDRKLKKRKRPSSPQIELAILSSSSPSLATTRISGTCKRSTSPTVDITASTSVITTKPDERDDPQRRYKFMDVRDVSHPFVPPKIRLATEKPRITIAPIENKLKPAMVSPRILNYRSPISKTPGGHNAEADKSNTSSGCGNIESGKNCKSDHFSKQHKNINYGSMSQMNFNGESSLNGINRNHNSSKPEDNGCKTKELLSKKLENSNLIFRKRSDKGWIKETVKPRVSRK